ncbi:cytochrome b561 domain-containing protein [Pelagibius sp. Alg239-R121]|uniref:cytochrome b561 domain-containing protein n=1 Tax=Pelagibius sp. Alg239-R121 TaxID=2993448 RepID=UPI0024A6DACF|nr:cytochrome b561 domain-containing protein [Pelagibius sp. Alg239-R121]
MEPLVIHALVMLFAWLVLIPIGVLAARFFKVLPRQDWPRQLDNQAWWKLHQFTQYSGVVLMLIAVYIAVSESGELGLSIHGILGLAAVILACGQVLSGWLRGSKGGPTDRNATPDDTSSWRGDHYDMTGRRLSFEAWHKCGGYLAMGLAFAAIATGMLMIGWSEMIFGLAVVFTLALWILFVVFERLGLRKDTYQAIWGPDKNHPGNSGGKP